MFEPNSVGKMFDKKCQLQFIIFYDTNTVHFKTAFYVKNFYFKLSIIKSYCK